MILTCVRACRAGARRAKRSEETAARHCRRIDRSGPAGKSNRRASRSRETRCAHLGGCAPRAAGSRRGRRRDNRNVTSAVEGTSGRTRALCDARGPHPAHHSPAPHRDLARWAPRRGAHGHQLRMDVGHGRRPPDGPAGVDDAARHRERGRGSSSRPTASGSASGRPVRFARSGSRAARRRRFISWTRRRPTDPPASAGETTTRCILRNGSRASRRYRPRVDRPASSWPVRSCCSLMPFAGPERSCMSAGLQGGWRQRSCCSPSTEATPSR